MEREPPELPKLPASEQAKLRSVQAEATSILCAAEAEIEHLWRALATDEAAWLQPEGDKEWRRRSADLRSRAEADATYLVVTAVFEAYAKALDTTVPDWHDNLEDYLCAISNELPLPSAFSEGLMRAWFDAEFLRACSELRRKVYARMAAAPAGPAVAARSFKAITDAWRESNGLTVEQAAKQIGIGKSRLEQLRSGRRGGKPVKAPSSDELDLWAMRLQCDVHELRRAFALDGTETRTRSVRR